MTLNILWLRASLRSDNEETGMAEAPEPKGLSRLLWFSGTDDRAETIIAENQHAAAAIQSFKREGIEMAVRARIVAMIVIAVMVMFLTPWPDTIYYLVLIVLFVLIGLAQRAVARVGTSRAELALLFCDLLLMTIIALAPNPFSEREFPGPFVLQFDVHQYFFVLLAMATLAYSWRTIFAVGTWTTALWLGGLGIVWFYSMPDPALRETLFDLYGEEAMVWFLDPHNVAWDQRIQQSIVFLMCALILGFSVRRFNNLLLAQASAERERANLARYFSPNVVDELSATTSH